MKVKSIVLNPICLLSPNSSKDRELLNSWWTRTGTSTPERSPKIQITDLYSAWRCRKRIPPTKCPCHAYRTSLISVKLYRRTFQRSLKFYTILYYSDKMFDRTARENFQRPVVPNLFQICTRITLARLAICLRLPNTLAMRLSNFMMILMNYYVEFELSLS